MVEKRFCSVYSGKGIQWEASCNFQWAVKAKAMPLKPEQEKTMFCCTSKPGTTDESLTHMKVSLWWRLFTSPVLCVESVPPHTCDHRLNVDCTNSATACLLLAGVKTDKFDLLMHKREESSLWCPPTRLIQSPHIRGGMHSFLTVYILIQQIPFVIF